MNEQLIVKNFGPIKDATVDFKKVTVFIGPTGGGKSTLAKLAAVFRDIKFHSTEKNNLDFVGEYARDSYFSTGHFLSWGRGDNIVSIENKKTFLSDELAASTEAVIKSFADEAIKNFTQEIVEKQGKNPLKFTELQTTSFFKEAFDEFFRGKILTTAFSNTITNTKPEYIPSERVIIASLEYSWAGLMRDDIGLPKVLLDFANNFSLARKDIFELDIPFLKVKYQHINGRDFVRIPEREEPIMLLETASGIQSVTPMLVLLEHLSRQKEQAQSFIIEEPELNLYPTAQQGLLNWLVEKCTAGENDLTITTHSPYILSHLNLLLYAYQVAEKHPDRTDDVAKIVPRESWINPKEFACYHVAGQKENGVHSIVNSETGLISYNDLDALAGNSATEFDQLLDINAGLEVE